MMRVLVCDYHVVFAESLAHLLSARGKQVVAVAHSIDDALAVLRAKAVDVCLLDVVFGGEDASNRLGELRHAAPATHLVLLSGALDGDLVATARAVGVRGIAHKRQPVAEVIGLLDRVGAGQLVVPWTTKLPPPTPAGPHPIHDTQRLAGFLTPRERQIVSGLVCGKDTSKLARSLGITATTARCHIQSVLTKMGAHSRLEVATTAVRAGIVSPETGEWLIPVQ